MVLDDNYGVREQKNSMATEAISHPMEPYLHEKRSCIFYKLMVASIIQDKKLRIPDKFVRKFGDELSSATKLTIPSCRTWLVELRKDNHKLWFYEGWHEFIEGCSIQVGYLLVFKYQGDSNFNVHIFDLATSEISYPRNTVSSLHEPGHAKQCSDRLEKNIEENNSLEILASCPSCPPNSSMNKVFYEGVCYNWNKNSKFGVSSENLHPIEEVCNLKAARRYTRDIGIQLNGSELTAADEPELHFAGVTGGGITSIGRRTDPCKHKVKAELPGGLKTSRRGWTAVTTEEKWRTVRAAEMFKPDHPFFRVILRRYNICKGLYLHIPATFARKYLSGFTGNITLLDSDRKSRWLVRCCPQDGRVKLTKGWSVYARDNNLDEGDVCVFELIKSNDVALKVTIFRVLEDPEPLHQAKPKQP